MDDSQEGSLSIVKRISRARTCRRPSCVRVTLHEIRGSGSLWGLVDPLLHRVAHEFGVVLELEFFQNAGTVGTDGGGP